LTLYTHSFSRSSLSTSFELCFPRFPNLFFSRIITVMRSPVFLSARFPVVLFFFTSFSFSFGGPFLFQILVEVGVTLLCWYTYSCVLSVNFCFTVRWLCFVFSRRLAASSVLWYPVSCVFFTVLLNFLAWCLRPIVIPSLLFRFGPFICFPFLSPTQPFPPFFLDCIFQVLCVSSTPFPMNS